MFLKDTDIKGWLCKHMRVSKKDGTTYQGVIRATNKNREKTEFELTNVLVLTDNGWTKSVFSTIRPSFNMDCMISQNQDIVFLVNGDGRCATIYLTNNMQLLNRA